MGTLSEGSGQEVGGILGGSQQKEIMLGGKRELTAVIHG